MLEMLHLSEKSYHRNDNLYKFLTLFAVKKSPSAMEGLISYIFFNNEVKESLFSNQRLETT